MARSYDNWEKLVNKVLRVLKDRELAMCDSIDSTRTSNYSFSSSSSYRFEETFDSLTLDDQGNFWVDDSHKRQFIQKPQTSSFLGKAWKVGLRKAVEVLDTAGSSMTNLNSGGFTPKVKRNKISIFAFEVANTIAKGANLFQSLSKENVEHVKKEILPSEGVRRLVSIDMNELLSITAADIWKEFDVFSLEVLRFGNLCDDPKWHNLTIVPKKLQFNQTPKGKTLSYSRFLSTGSQRTKRSSIEEAEMTMQQLTTLAQHTAELYHEFHTLDRVDQDYQRELDELDANHFPSKGESLNMLLSELKHSRKIVRDLKKKSLWSKSLEQVVEKLVDIVVFIHQEISEAYGDNGLTHAGKVSANKPERLGVAGLALHYANIITQIDNIASRPTSLPPNTRDTLYNGLPPTVKAALRQRLQIVDSMDELTVPKIKAEMEKILQWLSPLAANTTKAHEGFGWVGEWANTSNEFGKKTSPTISIIRLQTLYHADKRKVELYILELVSWLHSLINLVRYRDNTPKPQPFRSPTRKASMINLSNNRDIHKVELSLEDRCLLEEVMKRGKLMPGHSKSQEFVLEKEEKDRVLAFSKSLGSSPQRERNRKKADALDVLDGLDSSFVSHR